MDIHLNHHQIPITHHIPISISQIQNLTHVSGLSPFQQFLHETFSSSVTSSCKDCVSRSSRIPTLNNIPYEGTFSPFTKHDLTYRTTERLLNASSLTTNRMYLSDIRHLQHLASTHAFYYSSDNSQPLSKLNFNQGHRFTSVTHLVIRLCNRTLENCKGFSSSSSSSMQLKTAPMTTETTATTTAG